MAIQESNGINRDHLRYLGNSMSDMVKFVIFLLISKVIEM